MTRKVFAFLMFFMLLASTASAELTYNELLHSYAQSASGDTQILDNYLIGLYEGVNAANLAYYMQTREFMFCKPTSIELNVGDLKRIIKDSHDTFDQKNEIPVSYLLFIGMKKTFPCL
ncbi:MAG: hypothetical protein JRE63_09665 [Deltaproteobacteria bacterium]|jgi:hypothetical protein|nr:hypothetical protein [Deltaproteobacteria bacterium]MBW2519495.1 hypothetical protein [Deltaproteobacteria bacterium]